MQEEGTFGCEAVGLGRESGLVGLGIPGGVEMLIAALNQRGSGGVENRRSFRSIANVQ